jgi:uncharacterized repeat protein (TIGR03803 family)
MCQLSFHRSHSALTTRRIVFCLAAFVPLFACPWIAAASDITILHSFSGISGDGTGLAYELITDGTCLYSVAEYGPNNGGGAIFSLRPDGSQFQNIYSFSMYENGCYPTGIVLDGSTFYGTTLVSDGSSRPGSVFSVNKDGTGFTNLHKFTDSTPTDGALPYAAVIRVGSRLYGTTCVGGSANNGTVFSVGIGGSDFQIMHSFTGESDGGRPYGRLTANGSTLYGMSTDGGGTIYSINADGSGYHVIYSGAGGAGSLTSNGAKLYGMSDDKVFSINNDGTGFQVLHELSGASQSGLTLVGSTLYGMTRWGGTVNDGTIFRVNTDGSNYQVLHTFTGAANDGREPICNPLVIGNTLYGTASGGAYNNGIVFSMTVPEPSTFCLCGLAAIGLLGCQLRRQMKRE